MSIYTIANTLVNRFQSIQTSADITMAMLRSLPIEEQMLFVEAVMADVDAAIQEEAAERDYLAIERDLEELANHDPLCLCAAE